MIKDRNYFENIMHLSDLSSTQRLTIYTGCFGNEERTLVHLLQVYKVAIELNFNGVFHYIGSEITSSYAFDILKNEVVSFMYTFTIECFSNRNGILKNIKGNLSLDDYYNNMKNAVNFGFFVNYIYVLGLDSLNEMQLNSERFSEVTNYLPLINIFQPHVEEHLRLMDPSAHNIDYYIRARKNLEQIYKNTDLKPNSWECYRSLWYFKFSDEGMKCVRI